MPKIFNLLSYDAAERIEQLIHDSNLCKGDKLPSERELAQLFQMNRVTLRQGIQRLIDQGLLFSIANSGNYVAKSKTTRAQDLYFFPYADSHLLSEDYQQQDLTILDDALSSWSDIFEQNQQNVLAKRTLELVDQEPIAITRCFQKKASLARYGDIFMSEQQHPEILQRLKMRVYTPLDAEKKLLKIGPQDDVLMITDALVNDEEIFAIAESICVGTRVKLVASISIKEELDTASQE